MPHQDWCGKLCGKCENPCQLDWRMPCSPDCELLTHDGIRNLANCSEAGCDACD